MAGNNKTQNLVLSTTSTTVTTEKPGGSSDATNASFGVTALFLFIAVFIVVVCVRKRCRNKSQDSKNSEFSDEISDIFVQEDKFVRTTKQWVDLHEGIKAVIKGILIDVRRLELAHEIGKGNILLTLSTRHNCTASIPAASTNNVSNMTLLEKFI